MLQFSKTLQNQFWAAQQKKTQLLKNPLVLKLFYQNLNYTSSVDQETRYTHARQVSRKKYCDRQDLSIQLFYSKYLFCSFIRCKITVFKFNI